MVKRGDVEITKLIGWGIAFALLVLLVIITINSKGDLSGGVSYIIKRIMRIG